MPFRFHLLASFLAVWCMACKDNAPVIPEPGTTETTGFTQLSADESGLDFTNALPEDQFRNILRYQYYYNGGGVAIADFDADGKPDIVLSGNISGPRLFLNEGRMKFRENTAASGIRVPGRASWSTGLSVVDINADGHPDLYLCRSGNLQLENRQNLLFVNNGKGKFTEEAATYGLADPGYSMQAAWLDYDKDGDLDCYLANHGINFYGRSPGGAGQNAQYSGDKLYRNDNGRFKNVTTAAGIREDAISYGLGIAVGDLDQNGWDDIYVSNDYFVPDYGYLNQGDGTFRESIRELTRHTSFFSMGNDLADLDNDTLPDLITLDMNPADHVRRLSNISGITYEDHLDLLRKGTHHQYMYNAVQHNGGDGTFKDVAQQTGMANSDWSWSPLIADLDNDGLQDVYITNGLRKDVLNLDFINYDTPAFARYAARGELPQDKLLELLAKIPSTKVANAAYRNGGDLAFESVAAAWGLDEPSWSNGAAYGDLDGDGDLDLVVNNVDQPAFLYRNDATGNNAIRLRLVGREPNTQGLGAKIYLTTSSGTQYRQAYFNRGFLSAVEPVIHVGIGQATAASVRVEWPGTQVQTMRVKAGQIHVLREVDATTGRAGPPRAAPLFRPLALATLPVHVENIYDDFKRNYLLPHRLSAEGPYLAVGDADGDGRQDYYLGGSVGQSGRLLRQTREGNFVSLSGPWQNYRDREDAGAAFFDYDGDGDDDLFVASGGSEFADGNPRYRDALYRNDGRGRFSEISLHYATGPASCVRANDYDGDGHEDLFVGGRLSPRSYPESGQSFLLRGTDDGLHPVVLPANGKLGLVTDAIWTDYDSDGDEDLLLVGEWTHPRFLRNDEGEFALDDAGMREISGLYRAVAAGDFDGDGDPDYLLGNLGNNNRLQTPLTLRAGDLDDNGSTDLLLGYTTPDSVIRPLHGRDVLQQQLVYLKKQFPRFTQFAEASLDEVIGERADRITHDLTARVGASLYLENLGDGTFKWRTLPALAQLSTPRAFLVADYDGDGHLDALLAGNTYETDYRNGRSDAGTGLLLKGDGAGGFTAVPSHSSGFKAACNVRDMRSIEVAGRAAILVANNNGPVQLLTNTD